MTLFHSISAPIIAAFPELTEADLGFMPPPKLDMGDIALRTFEAARKLSVPPPQLAARIASDIQFGPNVLQVTTAGPYVNFTLNREEFAREIVQRVFNESKHFGSNDSGRSKRALVEHTSINPNASPHVGRARNALIGDSLVRLFRFEEYNVEAHYYVNDIGRQIALLVLACPHPESLTFDQMLQVYTEANARSEADPEFKAAAYELLAKIEQGDEATRAKFHAITDLCLKGQVAVLARLGIQYDCFDHESDFVKDQRLEPVLAALKERGALFTDEDDRICVDLAKLGYTYDDGRYVVLLRSNGSSMYGYRDLAYTLYKMERGAELNLIVLGDDHKLYMQQLALILGAANKSAPEPIHYSYILLKEGKMSTRMGKVVLLSDFLDEATRRASEKVNEQCGDLSADERQKIASAVAVAAVRFAILRVSATKNVIFDWESSLSFVGDTGPYVQYSCARISSILRKVGAADSSVAASPFPVETNAEWALLMKIASFNEVVANAAQQRSIAPVAQFALETARLFTSFYHECPVKDAPTEAQRNARIQLCAATRQALTNALHLIGIEALERM